MSFGKRGEEPTTGSVSVRAIPLVAPPVKKSVSLDKSFAAIVLGVVIISAGGAMAAPSVLSWVGGSVSGGVRPVGTVIAGLDRDHAKAALSREAFPDQAGRDFMASLQSNFPEDHDRLLGNLADKAMQGGSRDELMVAVNEWTIDFAPRNLSAIGRTGADGFDQVLSFASDGLRLLEASGGGNCTLGSLQKLAANPENLTRLGSYGSEGYKLSMRANRMLVDLAAKGRNAPPADTNLRPEDEQAVQSAFYAMMQDPQIMSLMQTAMMQQQRGGPSSTAMNSAAERLNVCQLGRTVVVKLKNLPSGTKARLWGLGMSQARLSL